MATIIHLHSPKVTKLFGLLLRSYLFEMLKYVATSVKVHWKVSWSKKVCFGAEDWTCRKCFITGQTSFNVYLCHGNECCTLSDVIFWGVGRAPLLKLCYALCLSTVLVCSLLLYFCCAVFTPPSSCWFQHITCHCVPVPLPLNPTVDTDIIVFLRSLMSDCEDLY